MEPDPEEDLMVTSLYSHPVNLGSNYDAELKCEHESFICEPLEAGIEIAFESKLAHLVGSYYVNRPFISIALKDIERLVLSTVPNSNPHAVIERTFTDLTSAELKQHKEGVRLAKIEEERQRKLQEVEAQRQTQERITREKREKELKGKNGKPDSVDLVVLLDRVRLLVLH